MRESNMLDAAAPPSVNDQIVVTVPTEPGFRAVVSLVLGGVGSRLDLPYERMDDLQLAVLSMLDAASGDVVSIEIGARDDRVTVSAGPLRAGSDQDDGLTLVLDRLTDGVESVHRDGAVWITVWVERAVVEPARSVE